MNTGVGQSGKSPINSPVNSLVLVLTTRCQLRCPYCSQGEMLPRQDMSPEVLRKALLLASQGTRPLQIQLTGGEPTLVPELVRLAITEAAQIKRFCTLAIQTNGVQLDTHMVRFWKKHGLQVGVSLDGTPRIQEAVRGQAGATLRGLLLLEEEGVPFNITTVLSSANVQELDRLVWLLAGFEQARGIGLDILVQRGRAARNKQVSLPDKKHVIQGLERLLLALETVNRERNTPLRLRELDLVRRCLQQGQQGRSRTFCLAACGESLAVAPDGRLFPCAQVLGEARFSAGTVDAPQPVPPFPALPLNSLQKDCSSCLLRLHCPDDCPSRLSHNQAEERLLACTLYQILAHYPGCEPGQERATPTVVVNQTEHCP